jgi:hypothetical protein
MLTSAHKWIVILCLAAILVAALTPAHFGLLVAILIPLSFLFYVAAGIPVRRAAEQRDAQRFPLLPVLASRPPPAG